MSRIEDARLTWVNYNAIICSNHLKFGLSCFRFPYSVYASSEGTQHASLSIFYLCKRQIGDNVNAYIIVRLCAHLSVDNPCAVAMKAETETKPY